ncbi:hypothetical protein Q3G72_034502 [Acer saccharum]|nr:hypothetical protein Q3G72_034502 [Acer saccharum]
MGCLPKIPLNVLNEEEGLVLFKRHSGLNDDQSLTKIKWAKEVVEECKGLPLAIVAIGSALKEKAIDEWKIATQKLKKSKLMDVDIVDQKLYACLKLSYDYLNNERTKSCFLLCSLFPEDHEIDMEELVRYGPGLGLYQNTDSIEEARSELHVMVNRLKASSLLLDAEEGYVKMHDVVRDVALWITSKGEEVFMVKAGMGLTEWPKHEGLEQCTAISLLGNHIEVLPDGYDIRVNDNDWVLASYPKSRLLKVTGIEATSLFAFKALYENVEYLELGGIKGCCQNMVPSIDETGLNELKRLTLGSFDELECIIDTTQQQDVASTAFSNLVDLSLRSCDGLREICSGGRPPRGFIENLETLDIRYCNNMSSLFPSWVLIQRLRKLKKVTVWCCGELEDVFQLEGLCYAKENPFLLSSLESLDLWGLRNLRYIWKGPTQQVSLQSLTVVEVNECDQLRYLFTLSLARSLSQLEQLTKLRVLEVGIISDQLCNSVLAQLIHGFQNLEELKIRECRVQVLSQLELSLPSLKVLELGWLEELECLCKGPTHLLSLPNLKKLSVRYCNRLRHMFSPSLARNLLQLEELFILYCGELEQIFTEDDIAEYNQTLLKDHLQSPLLFPNLSSIDISNCGKLKSVFPVSIAHLLSLQNLTTLELSNCDGLTHLFSSTLARNLLQLESIDIMDCGELEQIIVEDHTEDHHVQVGLFPNLSSISVYKCGKLKTLFPTVTIARSGLQKLKTIYIGRSFQLEELFGHKDEVDMTSHRETVLPQLQKLTLKELASLINFCPVGYHFIFPSLSELFVRECPKITTRFSVDQNRSVHAEAKAPQTGKEDADMEQSPPETTREIYCREWMPNALRERWCIMKTLYGRLFYLKRHVSYKADIVA